MRDNATGEVNTMLTILRTKLYQLQRFTNLGFDVIIIVTMQRTYLCTTSLSEW